MEEVLTNSKANLSLDNASMQLFEEEQFFFPLTSQRDARAFVKALAVKGYGLKDLCEEIGEPEQNFTSWRKGLGRSGVGKSIMERINRPYQQMLNSEGSNVDHSEWLAAEIPKYQQQAEKLCVNKIESLPSNKSAGEPKAAAAKPTEKKEEKVDSTSAVDDTAGIGTKDRVHHFEMQTADSRRAQHGSKEDSPARKPLEPVSVDVGESDENVVSTKERVLMFEQQSPTKKSGNNGGDDASSDRSSPSKTIAASAAAANAVSTKERMQMFEQQSPSSARKAEKEEITPMVAGKSVKEATAGVSAKDRAQIFEQSSPANSRKQNNGANGKDDASSKQPEAADTSDVNTKNKVQIFEQLNSKKSSATPSPRESPEKTIAHETANEHRASEDETQNTTKEQIERSEASSEISAKDVMEKTEQTDEKLAQTTGAERMEEDICDEDVSLFVEGIIGGALRAVEHEKNAGVHVEKSGGSVKENGENKAIESEKEPEEFVLVCEAKEYAQLEACPVFSGTNSNSTPDIIADSSSEPEIKVAVVETEAIEPPTKQPATVVLLDSPISGETSTDDFTESDRKKSEERDHDYHLGTETSEDELVQDADGLKRYKKKKRKSVTWALPEEEVAAMAAEAKKKADESAAAKMREILAGKGHAPIASFGELESDVDLVGDDECGSYIVIPAGGEVDVDALPDSKKDRTQSNDEDEEFFDSVAVTTLSSSLAMDVADDDAVEEATNGAAGDLHIGESYDSDEDDARVLDTTAEDEEAAKQDASLDHPHDGPGFVYVFAESRPSNGAETTTDETSYFKLGASRFPQRRLAQGRHFNMFLTMAANVPVTRRILALEHIKAKVTSFAVEGHDGWYQGSHGDFVSRVSKAALRYST